MNVTAVLVLLGAAGILTPLALPGGEGGIGFDDLRFSPELHKLLVPAGASGRLDLVDPKTQGVSDIAGFSTSPQRERGHSQGTTSADSGDGLIFASDRTAGTLAIVDPAAKRILSSVKLGGAPDYVRWVAPLREVWVSEPGSKTIEAFRLDRTGPPALVRAGSIEVADGPEALAPLRARRRGGDADRDRHRRARPAGGARQRGDRARRALRCDGRFGDRLRVRSRQGAPARVPRPVPGDAVMLLRPLLRCEFGEGAER